MAPSFGFVKALLILLAMSSAIATPVAVYEYAPGGVRPSSVLPRQLHPRATPNCAADNILRDLRNPTQTAAASSFCSLYLQPTTITTSTLSISQTGTATYSTTTTATVTTISEDIISTTVTCAASPTAPATCNYQALYNYGVSFISGSPGVDNTTCHENCLANPACQSFQVADPSSTLYYPYCNLFSENTLAPGNVGADAESEFTFFDRDCPDYLPEECTSSPPAATVTAKKHKRTVALPTYFATVPASRISSACSCFIASPAPTSTSVIVVTTTVSFTTTTSGTETDTATLTAFATTTEASIVTASP